MSHDVGWLHLFCRFCAVQGSEARAQVISHHGDPFGMHAAAAAAQQQAMKRPRMQMQMQQQPLLQAQGLSAGLMQQQLAAAVAASGAPSALQPLQQLQALAGLTLPAPTPLTSVSGPLGMHMAGPSTLTPAGSTAAALPQPPTRYVAVLIKVAVARLHCSCWTQEAGVRRGLGHVSAACRSMSAAALHVPVGKDGPASEALTASMPCAELCCAVQAAHAGCHA